MPSCCPEYPRATPAIPTNYEHIAARYDADRARFTVPPDAVVVALAARSTPACVLDVGCGTGTWLRAQADVVAGSAVTLLGADPSRAMLDAARGKGLTQLVLTGAEWLPFADHSIDYIVANFTFHHWDKERGLDEVARVLAPEDAGFRIFNIEPANADGWWLYDFFPEAIALDRARFWPASRIHEALTARGFTVEVELDSERAVVPIGEALADAERRVISQLATIDDDAYARGLTRLREAARDTSLQLTAARATVRVNARR